MIAQVVAPGAVGGLETVVGELLTSATRAGQPAIALALLPPSATVPAVLAEAAALPSAASEPDDHTSAPHRLVRIPAAHRRYRAHYRALRDAAQAHGVRLLHSHGYHADIITAAVARSLGLPHVSTLHGFVGLTRRSRFYEWLQLRALRRSHAVIAVSQPIAERAIASGIAAARVHVVRNAAPTLQAMERAVAREALGLPSHAPVVGWVGRVSGEKGPERFVDLMQALARDTEIVGIMMGDGPVMAEIRRAAQANVPADRLLLPGVVKAAGRYLRALDALVLTSHTEGTPMVVLEAMQAGVPVISTAVGGVPSMLEGGAGVLVPDGDAHALCEAVTRVTRDASLADSLRATACARAASSFGVDAWWAQHASLYAAAGVS